MNPLFNLLGGQQNPMVNMMNLMNQFSQFKSTFQGDPKAQVQSLLNSGKMSQAQFNQLQAMATQIEKMMKK